jgi:hypothetical protein
VDVQAVTLFVNDADFQLYVGDVREQLRQLSLFAEATP